MIILWIGVLCFLLGFLLAFFWQQYRRKKDAQRWVRQKKQMERELSKVNERVLSAKNAAAASDLQCRQIRKQLRETALPASSQQPSSCSPLPSEEKPDIRNTFQSVESLRLEFQYLLPDSLILQAGKGFLRNAQNALIPEADTFQSMNSAAGYAMEGLFYLYDVAYQGKEYTFRKILNGEMGSGYVRVQSVIKPAKVARVGETGYYRLSDKGMLYVVDVQ